MAASFPTSVASNNALIVADNRKSTTLLGAISSGITTIVVSSGVFSANSVVTIQNERILLGSTVVPGTYTGCTRGYDNSTAASHANGLTVSANVVAAHHNVLREEIQAVETALGTNLSFVQKTFNASGFVWSFAGTTNLTGLAPAGVTIPNTPGILAASVNTAYIYITDGGSSETVLLTFVDVGATTTLIRFTPVNSHTAGQWTLGSASGGFQEAVKYAESLSGGGAVQLPRGSTTQPGQVFIDGDIPIDIYGTEQGSILVPATQNSIVCSNTVHKYTLKNFTIDYGLSAPAPGSGIFVENGISGRPIIDGVTVLNADGGIIADTMTGLTIRNCTALHCLGTGIVATDVTDLILLANTCNDNDQGASGSSGIILNGGTRVIINSNTCTNTAGTTQNYGLTLAGAIDSFVLSGNNFEGNQQAPILDTASSRTLWTIGTNCGLDTRLGAITAASTITLDTYRPKVTVITGTTTINTINGFYGNGHEFIFICPNSLTFSAAGNIAVALTTTFANQIVRGVYNVTAGKWYVYA